MEGLAAVSGLILSSTCGLIANQVWPSAAQACGAHSLMGIHHNMVLGGLFDAIEIVVIHPLTIVVFSTGNDITYVSALHSSVAIFVHQIICSL